MIRSGARLVMIDPGTRRNDRRVATLRQTGEWMDVVLEELQREHARIFCAISAIRAAADDVRREIAETTSTPAPR